MWCCVGVLFVSTLSAVLRCGSDKHCCAVLWQCFSVCAVLCCVVQCCCSVCQCSAFVVCAVLVYCLSVQRFDVLCCGVVPDGVRTCGAVLW